LRKLAKFVRLPAADRALLVRAAASLLGVRLAMAVMPFRRVERLVGLTWAVDETRAPVPRERLVWAVTVASRLVPSARCLAQALVLKGLLERHGYPACLRMGFARDEGDTVSGHAWVECQGQVVLGGGPLLSRFAR